MLNKFLPVQPAGVSLIASLVLMAGWHLGHAQQLYRCEDPQRQVVYQDQPCSDGRSSEVTLDEAVVSEQGLPGTRGNGWLWRAEKADRSIYLTGSIHYGNEDLYPLPGAVMEAFELSAVLMVEADITDRDLAKGLLLSKGTFQDGSTLEQRLDPAIWAEVQATANAVNFPINALVGQKPWLASITLSGFAVANAGFSLDLGVDRYFLNLASEGGKQVVELEGLEYQIDLMDGLPRQTQEFLLRQAIQEINAGPDQARQLVNVWKEGNIAALETLVEKEFDSNDKAQRLAELLLARRNRTMAERIDSTAVDAGNYFVVVGAAHMVGENNLPDRLRQRGFSVEQLGVR